MVKARLFHHEMHMTWPVAMPLQQFQQLADRPVIGNRVWYWYDRLEPKDTLFVTMHHSSLVRLLAAFILHIVLSIAVRFPNIDLYTFYWLSFCILHSAYHETWLAFRIMRNLGAVGL